MPCPHNFPNKSECEYCPPPEPTTAEAFAAIRRQVDRLRRKPEWISTNDERELDDALTLLERRMGEMERRVAEVDAFWSDPDRIDV